MPFLLSDKSDWFAVGSASTVNGSTPSLTQSTLSGSSRDFTFATPRTSYPPLFNNHNSSPSKDGNTLFTQSPLASWPPAV